MLTFPRLSNLLSLKLWGSPSFLLIISIVINLGSIIYRGRYARSVWFWYVSTRMLMRSGMRRAINTISPAVMEYAGAIGLLAKWRLIVLSRYCQYFPKRSKCRRSYRVTKRRHLLWVCARRSRFVVIYIPRRWSLLLQTGYNVP